MDHNHSIPRDQLQEFVQSHFQPVGQELQSWTPEDWKDRYCSGGTTGEGPSLGAASANPVGPSFFSPQFLQKISDAKLRVWAEELHRIWKKLGKKVAVARGLHCGPADCSRDGTEPLPVGTHSAWDHRYFLRSQP